MSNTGGDLCAAGPPEEPRSPGWGGQLATSPMCPVATATAWSPGGWAPQGKRGLALLQEGTDTGSETKERKRTPLPRRPASGADGVLGFHWRPCDRMAVPPARKEARAGGVQPVSVLGSAFVWAQPRVGSEAEANCAVHCVRALSGAGAMREGRSVFSSRSRS